MFIVLRLRNPDTVKAISQKHNTEQQVPKRRLQALPLLNIWLTFQDSPHISSLPWSLPQLPQSASLWLVAKTRTAKAGTPRLTSQPHNWLAGGLWVSVLTSLSFCVLIHETEIIFIPRSMEVVIVPVDNSSWYLVYVQEQVTLLSCVLPQWFGF